MATLLNLQTEMIAPYPPLIASRLSSNVPRQLEGALPTGIEIGIGNTGNTLSAMVGWQGGRDKAQGNRTPHRTEGDLAVLIAPRQSRGERLDISRREHRGRRDQTAKLANWFYLQTLLSAP